MSESPAKSTDKVLQSKSLRNQRTTNPEDDVKNRAAYSAVLQNTALYGAAGFVAGWFVGWFGFRQTNAMFDLHLSRKMGRLVKIAAGIGGLFIGIDQSKNYAINTLAALDTQLGRGIRESVHRNNLKKRIDAERGYTDVNHGH
eukprot:TRINITY_DN18800_c0_g1_i1.p1 TRINITY_DN18800_c0_g1~~TRINITY_DN18800_c0_g1_i1.p1  ORF type:complete len:155 (-),score=18.25 TRINITY_DN18800_c0_g1_i1:48-476(-)